MSRETPVNFLGFKGINLREPAGAIQDEELALCKNLNIGRSGELTKRTGFSLLTSSLGAGNVQLLGHFKTADHSVLLSIRGPILRYSSNGSSWTTVGNSSAYRNIVWAIQYTNKFYLIRYDNTIYEWSGPGNTPSTLAGSPAGTVGVVHKDRLFIANSQGSQNNRVWFSGIADFSDWPSTNFLDVNPGDGDYITSVTELEDLLIIFKTSSTWALFVQGAPENWVLRNISPEIGCISKYTPREIEGFTYFVGSRGVYRTDGNIPEEISSSIEPIFRERIVNLTTTNIDEAAWWEDRYIVLMHPDPSTYRYMVYHLRTGGWTEWEPAGNIRPAFFIEVNSGTPGKGLYAGNRSGNGSVYKHGDGAFTDAGQTYSCSFKMKDYDFGLPTAMKRGKWIGLEVDATGTVQVKHTVENEVLDPLNFSATGKRHLYKLRGPGYFRRWSLEVVYNRNNDFTFYVATLHLAQKRSVIKAVT